MSGEVTVGLVGIGGYGAGFVDTLLSEGSARNIRWLAAVEPRPEGCSRLPELKAQGIRIYSTMDELYRDFCPDLVVISSPIHFHKEQTCLALSHGSHVLCEKPVAATIQDALAMEAASAQAGRFAAIGYQMSFSEPIQALKRDILTGALGRPLQLKTFVSWPRMRSYYNRSAWAGALKNDKGDWILDSPVSNATAHYLHNMLYVLGQTRETSAEPASVEAELYRANAIANYDTGCLRCRTTEGVEVLFYTSHAVPSNIGPVLHYEFENAVVSAAFGAGDMLVARFRNGAQKVYGNLSADVFRKLWHSVDAVRGGAPIPCDVRSAIPHLLCVNGAQESMPQVVDFSEAIIQRTPIGEGDQLTSVHGLQTALLQCYDLGILPHEQGTLAWAEAGRVVNLRGYSHFPA